MARAHHFHVALLVAILAPALCLAANKTYIGSAGQGTWSVDTLWSPFGAPVGGDNAFLTPSDANNRTVVFNVGGSFFFDYGNVTVHSSGAGSITLLNTNTSIFSAPFVAHGLTLGDGGYYRQVPGSTSIIASTIVGGNPNTYLNGGHLQNDNGTYFATDVTQAAGVLYGGGAYILGNRYSFQAGLIGAWIGGAPRPHVTNNGTFEQSGNANLDCTFINNGTYIYSGGFASSTNFTNHGTIIATADLFVGKLDNFVSLSMPAGAGLASTDGITQNAGTFTQSNTVKGPVRVAGGTWHLLGGAMERREIPTGTNSSVIFGTLTVGSGGAPGTFLLSDGTVSLRPIKIGAANSSGTVLQTGGSVETAEPISVGATPEILGQGGRGFYSISGGSITTPSLLVGATDSGSGTYVQSGGTVMAETIVINQNLASSAGMIISGGVLSSAKGAVNNDSFTQTGGSTALLRIDGAGRVNVSGTASLSAPYGIRQDSVQLAGNARIATSPATPTPTSRVRSLSFDESGGTVHGTWDLIRGALVIDYTSPSPAAAIRRYLVSGYASGNWNGTGLNTSAPVISPGTALGYSEATEALGASGGLFEGVLVDSTAVLVKYTWYGDADLNGQVDIGDLGKLASHWQAAGGWSDADFDYNGIVNVNDLGLLAGNWQAGVGNPLGPSLAEAMRSLGLPTASVPEPAGISLLLASAALSCRRGQRSIRARA